MTSSHEFHDTGRVGHDARLLRAERVIDAIDKGIAVLSTDLVVSWVNPPFLAWCGSNPIGKHFFEGLDTATDSRPDESAFQAALSGSSACFRVPHGNLILDVTVSPIIENGTITELVAVCDDVTSAVVRQQKLNALYKAGQELDALDPDQLSEMNLECRVELLKQNLRKCIHDLLKYNVIEIRLLDRKTGRLNPLMEEGMTTEAAGRELYARTEQNGVTGFVAATSQPYLCPDTSNDPHFIQGSLGAKSSMTVPIVFHDEVIGTFNVESPRINAFGPEELQFTELFARELARTLHTLNLLNAQEYCAASQAIDTVNREVALPADDLLAVASSLVELLNGQKDVVEPLRRILADARKIKQAIHNVGGVVAKQAKLPTDPSLENMRVLVIDGEERIRRNAHQLLERKGCVVETAPTATEGIAMAKAGTYDAVLVAVKHKDMRGTLAYQALVKAVPLGKVILTQGFGYDGDHTVVNAKGEGYWLPVLYKPFIENQLVGALTCPPPAQPSKNTNPPTAIAAS